MDGSKFVVVNPSSPLPKNEVAFDWQLCVLCQKQDGAKLISPSLSKNADKFQGYKKLDKVLTKFDAAGLLSSLSFTVDIAKINNGSGIF